MSQKIAISALSLATVACIGVAFLATSANTMIHDYIINNPQVLMESVENYQKKEMQDRQAHATEDLKKNKNTILKDSDSPEAGNPKGDVTVVEFFD